VESVAFFCCLAKPSGWTPAPTSIPYLASWAESARLEVLEQTAALTGRLRRPDRARRCLGTDEHPDPLSTPTMAKPASTSPRTARGPGG